MNLNFSIPLKLLDETTVFFKRIRLFRVVIAMSIVLSITSTTLYLYTHRILAYGDAESHLNIAKRIVHSITPGFAQMGGIWLPIPHLLMVPFVWIEPLYRSGLAGSIVSGCAYIVSCVFIYLIIAELTKSKISAFVGFLAFALNPNILYIQSTPMTELTLIMFFVLSSYYFIKYIQDTTDIVSLILAAFFGFCATLSRYDGWFLVLFEALIIILLYIRKRSKWKEMEGKLVLFSTLAFFGVFLWMGWDYLILGDAFYFTNSQFSAKAQQLNWLARGELPAYHNMLTSFLYYFVTAMSNAGIFVFLAALIGVVLYFRSSNKNTFAISLVLFIPFIFNVVTLYLGQSVIFIPHLTPVGFEWRLFNVRYGVMLIPTVAFFFAYMFYRLPLKGRTILIVFFIVQFFLYAVGYSKVISLADGTEGLSQAKQPDAEMRSYCGWIRPSWSTFSRTASI
jgi:4-amino-4-deoxy-L-arabinose transferase-like glycosyltransferase